MSTDFVVTAYGKPDRFKDRVSKGDAVTYYINFSPWQEENSDITSVTWTVEAGQASVSGASESAGFATALVTFSSAGNNLISILATTATQKKKVWLEVYAADEEVFADDYGLTS